MTTARRRTGSLAGLALLFALVAPPDATRAAVGQEGGAGQAAPDTVVEAPGADSADELPPPAPVELGGLSARPIGPALMSGRITSIDGVSGDPPVLYVGTAGGGVWRSEDGGVTFDAVFDEHTQSIGAVSMGGSGSDTVWVGTGESWARNSVSVGTGVYRTTDGGETWEHRGLAGSERIAAIAVDPTDPARVFVCATGPLWNAGGERGVYRTEDAGASWEPVLQLNEDTGCSDLAMDPEEPGIMYAGMWQFRRWPWFFESGGPGSGLYRSTDGGDSWTELEAGLPEGEKGRIAVAVAPSRPSRLYAVVESGETALYRSNDLGEHWERVNSSTNVQYRPFYFAHVVVDPTDHRRVYKPGLSLSVSEDGGESFTSPFLSQGLGSGVHSDHHALWIDPADPATLVLGTDGGVYVSRDTGAHWRHVEDLPVSQFYEVDVDDDWPYRVYGGLQDNGSWMGPSRARGGVKGRDWTNIGFGDGFHAFPDPTDDDLIYVEYQGGNVMRFHRSTGEIKRLRPYAGEGEEELRFNWNTPLHASDATPGTLYLGAQYLFRSRDRGETWERISPDLTTDDPEKQRQEESGGLTTDNTAAENHTTIFTIADSPLDGDVIWVGTDDGNLQLTRDGGESWTNLADRIPGLPAGTWVSHVEASPHRPGTAFVAFDGHRTGDMSTYLYRTDDFGESWERIAGGGTSPTAGDTTEAAADTARSEDQAVASGNAVEGYAHAVVQDPEDPDLLFAGTELGAWVSLDGGEGWTRLKAGLPRRVPVRDLEIHPREHDLVLGTHGRGIWIVDDITPLRHLDVRARRADLALLPSRSAVQVASTSLQDFPGDGEFRGPNPPDGATIHYWQRERHIFGDLSVEILDDEGDVVAELPGAKRRGLVRVEWAMRREAPKIPAAGSLLPVAGGPRVPTGQYTVRVVKGDTTVTGKIEVVADPRSSHTQEDRAAQHRAVMRLYRMLETLAYVTDVTTGLRDDARARADETRDDGLAERLRGYADRLDAYLAEIAVTEEEGTRSGAERLREEIGALYGAVSGFDGRPTGSQLEEIDALETRLEEAEGRHAELLDQDLRGLNRRLADRGLPELEYPTRSEWEEER